MQNEKFYIGIPKLEYEVKDIIVELWIDDEFDSNKAVIFEIRSKNNDPLKRKISRVFHFTYYKIILNC